MTTTDKQQAFDFFEAYRFEYLESARKVADSLWRENQQPISTDDIRARIQPPEGVNPTVMGAVFKSKEWTAVGLVNSKRPEAHGRAIRTFAKKVTY